MIADQWSQAIAARSSNSGGSTQPFLYDSVPVSNRATLCDAVHSLVQRSRALRSRGG